MSFHNIQFTIERIFGVLPSLIEPNLQVDGIACVGRRLRVLRTERLVRPVSFLIRRGEGCVCVGCETVIEDG